LFTKISRHPTGSIGKSQAVQRRLQTGGSLVVQGIVRVVIACMEKYKSQLEEWRHWSNTRKMKKRQKESHLGRKRGRTDIQASGIRVPFCQCNVRTYMPEEKCFRTVNS